MSSLAPLADRRRLYCSFRMCGILAMFATAPRASPRALAKGTRRRAPVDAPRSARRRAPLALGLSSHRPSALCHDNREIFLCTTAISQHRSVSLLKECERPAKKNVLFRLKGTQRYSLHLRFTRLLSNASTLLSVFTIRSRPSGNIGRILSYEKHVLTPPVSSASRCVGHRRILLLGKKKFFNEILDTCAIHHKQNSSKGLLFNMLDPWYTQQK